jgi:hypothetical protein
LPQAIQEISDTARAELAGILLSPQRPLPGAARRPELAERHHRAIAEEYIVSRLGL